MRPVIQSLWIGDRLSALEKLAIRSHLYFEHEYHLYLYGRVEGVPDGVVLKNGNEILPENEIFTYQTEWGRGSYSAFSNYFRYKLLYEKGGWWMDSDVVCVQRLEFEEPVILASEILDDGQQHPTTCAIKCPEHHPLANYCWCECVAKDKSKIVWGEVGPRLLEEAINALSLQDKVFPPKAFCPINYYDFQRLVTPTDQNLGDSYAIHFWNEMWRRQGLDKNGIYPQDSVYEKLKRDFPQTKSQTRFF
jgi:hypothetical protein